ncbi:MAG TPA: MotA/TolQ/ExbB proton channel family protein [Planctomycetota bacterium]|nr:MotA/TolQ/ExbB proton channel family protein [Planctomycetota bacterium]
MRTSWLVIAMLLITLVATMVDAGEPAPAAPAAPAATAPAAPADTAAPVAATRMSLWDLLVKSGYVGCIIILLSFIGLALVIEDFITLQRTKLLPPHFIAELEDMFEQEQYEEALQLCESDDNLLSRIVGAGLSRVDKGFEAIEEAMGDAAEMSALAMHQKLSYLTLIYTIAPMLGLLGTVVGMVISFAVLAEKGVAANPSDLAGGISMALITTVEGLVVAIPLMAWYHYFRNRVMRFDLETMAIATDLMRRFKPAQKAAS